MLPVFFMTFCVSPGFFYSSWGILPIPAWPWKKGYTENTWHPLVEIQGWTKISCSRNVNKSHVFLRVINSTTSLVELGRVRWSVRRSWSLGVLFSFIFFIFISFTKNLVRTSKQYFFWKFFYLFFSVWLTNWKKNYFFMDYLDIREGVIKTRKNLISSQYGKKSSKIYFIPKMVEKGISKSHWLPKQQVLNHYWKSNRP